MIRSRIASLVTLALALSACGSVSPADQALQRMHDVYLKQAAANVHLLQQSELSKTTTNVTIATKRDAKTVKVDDHDFGVVANASLALASEFSSDVRNHRSPIADGTIKIEGSITVPAGTFTGMQASGAPPEKASADLLIAGRSVDQKLLLRISGISMSSPLMPYPFELPAELSSRWYGITFDDLDAKLSENSKVTGEPAPPPVRELLSRSLGNHLSPKALLKLGKSLHVWNGIELLPEENGQVHIRVESDKKKVQASVRAFVEYVKETSGQDWDAQFARNPEMKEKVEALLEDDAEFMKTMGTVKGVLSADATTYEFMGFDGEILDPAGTVKAHVTITRTKSGDFGVAIWNPETKEDIRFGKNGKELIGNFSNRINLQGTVTEKAVNLSLTDMTTGKNITSISLGVEEFTTSSMKIVNGMIKIPSEKLTIYLKELSVKIMPPDGVTMRLDASADVGAAQSVTLQMDAKRETIKELKVDSPAFKPLESLYQDLLQAVIGAAETEGLPDAE